MIFCMGREFFFTRFTSEVEVVFNARTITAYLDATILTKDSVIADVGVADEEDLLPSVPEKKKVFFLSGKGGYPPPLTDEFR